MGLDGLVQHVLLFFMPAVLYRTLRLFPGKIRRVMVFSRRRRTGMVWLFGITEGWQSGLMRLS